MRQFLHTSRSAENEVLSLLQSIFSTELIASSNQIWLVSPWLSDIDILDNRTGAFRTINPSWDFTWISLSRLLVTLMERGSRVSIVTRNAGIPFVNRIKAQARKDLYENRLAVFYKETLHAKGLLTDRCCLSGSMNFTFNGVLRLDEMLQFQIEIDQVAALSLAFYEEYGSDLKCP